MTTNVDAYPEQSAYLYDDEGCNLHPRCLSCPLLVCQYELNSDHGGPALDAVVFSRVADLMRQGLSTREIGVAIDATRRTAQRYTAAVRRMKGTTA